MKKINNIFITAVILVNIFFILKDIITLNFTSIVDYVCIFFVFLLPVLLNKFPKTKLTEQEELAYLIFAFTSDFLGSVLNLYDTIKWFDTLTHLVFGITSGFFGIYILTKTKLYDKDRFYVMSFMIIIVTLATACFWEIYEYIADCLFNTNLQSIETGVVDTMQDLLIAFIGVLIFCFIYIINKKRK